MRQPETKSEPSRIEIDAMTQPVLLEFGASWCSHCRATQPLIASAMAEHPEVLHLKIEDGKGRRLGRTFGVKLWPTLVLMYQGQEIVRLVRPDSVHAIRTALSLIDT